MGLGLATGCVLAALSATGVADAESRGGDAAHAHPSEPPPAGRFLTSLPLAKEVAHDEGRPVLVVFTAAWCEPCHAMKREVFPAPEVASRLARFVRVELDVESDEGSRAYLDLGVSGLPTMVVLDAQGQRADRYRVVGARTAEQLRDDLQAAIDGLQAPPTPGRERAAARDRVATGGGGLPQAPAAAGDAVAPWWWLLGGLGALAGVALAWDASRRRRRDAP